MHLVVFRIPKPIIASSARGSAWLSLPRKNPSKLIFDSRRIDPMWHFAYASNMNVGKLKRECSALSYIGRWLNSMVTLFSSISGTRWIRVGRSTVRVLDLLSGGFICMIEEMKHYIAIVQILLLIAALAVPTQAGAAQDRVVADSAPLEETKIQLPRSGSALRNDVPVQPPIAVPSESASPSYFRDIPSISGRYSIGGRALLPYLGAGFSGGYGSEFNRSLGGGPPTHSDFGLRSQFGQTISPNEFQMGLRIPF